MSTSHLKRAYQIAQNEGIRKLEKSSKKYIINSLIPRPIRIRSRAFYYRLSGHPGVGDPLRIYYIPLSDMNYCINSSVFPESTNGFRIMDGSWDTNAIPIEDFELYPMFEKHFKHGIPWEETDRFKRRETELRNHGSFNELDVPPEEQTLERFREYLQYLDQLYENIKTEGYKEQKHLTAESDFATRDQHPALNEIQVFVGRDGRLIARSGLHRACMAKLLELDSVPVRTQLRHTKWQELRDEIATNSRDELSVEARRQLSHPEVQDLL